MKALTYWVWILNYSNKVQFTKLTIEKMFGLTSTSMESILSSLSKVSISKSFFYALSLFHPQSCPECIHTSEKWKGLKKRFRN